jgi:hypothetical protein
MKTTTRLHSRFSLGKIPVKARFSAHKPILRGKFGAGKSALFLSAVSALRDRDFWISWSSELDDNFLKEFRAGASPDARLLILNDGQSSDRLLERIIRLKIRTPERVVILESGGSKTSSVQAILWRFVLSPKARTGEDRIFNATLEGEILHVVSTSFKRLDVPLRGVRRFASAKPAAIQNFEIDRDGSFIYWPDLDAHLGWNQLQQIVDPEAARKAQQKNQAFNVRYGQAVKLVRELAGLKRSGINGLSEKQLRRIEDGECRLTSNAIEALATAHKMSPNEYMSKLAEALS